jgi:anti-anti-sigma factor
MEGDRSILVTIDDRNDITRIAPTGELDMATVPTFEEILRSSEQAPGSVIMLDLRDITFMDTSGLHAFLEARDRARGNGHRLLFVGASPSVRRIFEASGMASVLDEHEAVSTIERFTRSRPASHTPGDPGDTRA